MEINSRARSLYAITIACTVAILLTTSLRLYVRIKVLAGFGWDDILMIAAVATLTTFFMCVVVAINYGYGQHSADLTQHDISSILLGFWIGQITYTTGIVFTRLSIGFFLLRIVTTRVQRWIVYVNMVVQALFGAVFAIGGIFQCHPISLYWDKNQEGSCTSMNMIIVFAYIISVAFMLADTTFTILPIYLVWTLHIAKRTKIMLCPILGLGLLATIANFIGNFHVQAYRNPDFSYASLDIGLWCVVESGIAVVASNLVTFRAPLRSLLSKLGMSSSGGSSGRQKTPRLRTLHGWTTRAKTEREGQLRLTDLDSHQQLGGDILESKKGGDVHVLEDIPPRQLEEATIEEHVSISSQTRLKKYGG